MRCSECGSENRDTARLCGRCRAKLERPCPRCQAENPPRNEFCDACGQVLDAPAQPRPIDPARPCTPRHLAEEILRTRSSLEGERKRVTVLFADVVDYAGLAKKLDPEEVHEIMDGCFRILLDAVHGCEGTVNQFTGDGMTPAGDTSKKGRGRKGSSEEPWGPRSPHRPAHRAGRGQGLEKGQAQGAEALT